MDNEQLTNFVTQQKQKANIINNMAIDFEHIRLMSPKIILAPKDTLKPEMKDNAKFILGLIDNVENELKVLKDILSDVISG